ncbi:MAG: CPBP family intramembrane metalloprotease, partial [Gemmiger sp.]|nr:CPBP family intramembrane metalloprotease [Gemmiger sp.]
FGEEYGWRYYLQPRMRQRFGPCLGVILLGVAWGLWHLPLNLFFYSPETSLQSIAAQLITCICLGVFFAFAYIKTQNIWVPVILHYLNNNLIPVFTGTVDISNQVYGWGDIGAALVLNGVVFLPFLLSSVFRKKQVDPANQTEQADAITEE